MHKFLFIILFIFPIPTIAQTISYECTYPSYSDESGNHAATNPLIVRFLVDNADKKAYVLGNNGSSEVAALRGPMGNVSFVELTDAGNVISTTIMSDGTSVHSRNSVVFSDLVASQYYGKCEMRE